MVINAIRDQEAILLRHIRDTTETITTTHRVLASQRAHLGLMIDTLRGDEEAVRGIEVARATDVSRAVDDEVMSGTDTPHGEETPRAEDAQSTVSARPGRTCRTCNQQGHDSRNCPSRQQTKARTCRTCNQQGHDSRNCPSKAQA